jgi:hypothetical protein
VDSRALLLGFLVGNTSGMDATATGDGLDEWRAVGVRAVEKNLREMHINVELRPLSISNLGPNASAIMAKIEKAHGETAERFFTLGLSLALLPIRHQQGLSATEHEMATQQLAGECGIEDLVNPLVPKAKGETPTYTLAVADVVKQVASRSPRAAAVFVCHAEEQRDMALQLAGELDRAGCRAWVYERDALPGVPYLVQTGQAIEQCEAFVLLVSKASMHSRQLTVELVRAHEAGKPMLPLLVDVTHRELQQQPEWRQALGAATSVSVPVDGIGALMPRILTALSQLGCRVREVPETGQKSI